MFALLLHNSETAIRLGEVVDRYSRLVHLLKSVKMRANEAIAAVHITSDSFLMMESRENSIRLCGKGKR